MYPEHWAQLEKTGDDQCLDLSGTYSNQAESAKGDVSISLAMLFFQTGTLEDSASTLNDVEMVKIYNTHDELHVEALKDARLVDKKVFNESDGGILCEEVFWTVKGSTFVSWSGFVGKASETNAYTVSTDGLVVKRRVVIGGLSLFIPIATSSEIWILYRNASIPSEENEQSSR
ncbi:hypothetical protein GCM10011352_25010 [Marinobacterium zhoushanense]|uniref:Lipocalin-like protein n=2 Tax=Marinobacterium zhoushanense TaxID=1679163 RepID=A0ABQ1KIY4_9GAMM|nr:hypothetical protein GCM10011352_25010 [Marinobacterium zhoushanense]